MAAQWKNDQAPNGVPRPLVDLIILAVARRRQIEHSQRRAAGTPPKRRCPSTPDLKPPDGRNT